jgi:hypothetical protein
MPHGVPAFPVRPFTTPKEVSHVYAPSAALQLARERQREMLAQAEQQRRGRQLAALARASRRAEPAQRPMRRALRALRLRAEPQQ